jgi:hypothetical protein
MNSKPNSPRTNSFRPSSRPNSSRTNKLKSFSSRPNSPRPNSPRPNSPRPNSARPNSPQSNRSQKKIKSLRSVRTTDVQDFFNDKSLKYEEFLKFLNSKKNCTSQISSKADINKVYKTCSHRVSNCDECKERLAIKLFKENTNEGHILKEINDGINRLPLKFQNYRYQIIEFRDFTTRNHTDILVTALVETGPNKTMNLKQYLDSGLPISSDSFNSIILQVILTLRMLTFYIAKDFEHIDLLVKQIFLRHSEPEKILWISKNYYVKLPNTRYTAVMGDFGYSRTKLFSQKDLHDRYYQTTGIGSDLFRFFWNLDNIASTSGLYNLKELIDKWTRVVFNGNFKKLLSLQNDYRKNDFNTYGYLPKEAQKYLPNDFTFLENSDYFKKNRYKVN